MKTYLKQSVNIILISILLASIRYCIISEDYDLIKKKKVADGIINNENINLSYLNDFIDNVNQPTIINFSIAKQIYNNKLATFLDARSVDSYLESHIKGSISLPYDDIESIEKKHDLIWMNEIGENYVYTIDNSGIQFVIGVKDNQKFIRALANVDSKLKKYETVFVIYCSGEGCSLSEDLAFYMFESLKINKILIYEGGMPEWIDNGLPIE